MANCLVAQSGGPTSVINATVAGIVKANQLNQIYDTVYGGLHGVEGILDEQFVDLKTKYYVKHLQVRLDHAVINC